MGSSLGASEDPPCRGGPMHVKLIVLSPVDMGGRRIESWRSSVVEKKPAEKTFSGCYEKLYLFNLDSGDNRVRVWRKTSQFCFRCTKAPAPTTCVIVWGAIAYETQSPLVSINDTMSTKRTANKLGRNRATVERDVAGYHSGLVRFNA
ncbi:hypothetical protein TNCV_4839071 [Trichonephila clavipes]|nr:hypothetical protein TNCV_4839071 [Trichonephila clavipes]